MISRRFFFDSTRKSAGHFLLRQGSVNATATSVNLKGVSKTSLSSPAISYGFFFNQRHVKHVKDDNRLGTDPGKVMRETSDSSFLKDMDDKFGLEKVSDPGVLLAHLQECQFSYGLNDLIFFVRKLAQLYKDGKSFKDRKEFKALLAEIKNRLESNQHETFPLIGSYAKAFKDLQVYDKKLWTLLEYKINEDQWYTNFKESLYALEGFTVFRGIDDQPRIDCLYEKIERITGLTVWDQNMLDYKRVVEALAQMNRFDPAIFAKIEMYILRNLSFDYELKTVVDILYAFGKGDIGQREFYDAVQVTIHKGHLFSRSMLLRTQELPLTGETTSKLLSIFSHAKYRIKDFELDSNFSVYMYKILMNKNTKFTLVNLIDTLRNMSKFEFEEQTSIESHLIEQILHIEGNVYFKDVQYAIEYLTYHNCGEFELTAPKIKHKLFEYVLQRIPEASSSDLIDMHAFMLKRNLLQHSPHASHILELMLAYLNEKLLQIPPNHIEVLLQQIDSHFDLLSDSDLQLIQHLSKQKNQIHDYLVICKMSSKLRPELIQYHPSSATEQDDVIPQLPLSSISDSNVLEDRNNNDDSNKISQ